MNKFMQSAIVRQTLATPIADERTLAEKTMDSEQATARIVINSDLSIDDGQQFINEMVCDREQRRVVIEKWRAYVAVLKTQKKLTADCLPMAIHRASKAAVAAQRLGWKIEYSAYGALTRIYWDATPNAAGV